MYPILLRGFSIDELNYGSQGGARAQKGAYPLVWHNLSISIAKQCPKEHAERQPPPLNWVQSGTLQYAASVKQTAGIVATMIFASRTIDQWCA